VVKREVETLEAILVAEVMLEAVKVVGVMVAEPRVGVKLVAWLVVTVVKEMLVARMVAEEMVVE